MSKTPLTDHYTKRLRNLCDDEFVPIEFARKLERELTAATAVRDEYKDLLIRVYDDLFVHRNMGEAVRDLKILMGAVQLTDALDRMGGEQ